MYFGSYVDDQYYLRVTNVDGTQIETLAATGGKANDVTLDIVNGHDYWTESSQDKIMKANLDGSAPEIILSVGNGPKGIEYQGGVTPPCIF